VGKAGSREKMQLALFTQNLKMSYYWLQYHSSIYKPTGKNLLKFLARV